MNVYQKLQKCRVDLKKLPIKESGNNKFAGYTYMELGDFLPHIVDLCETNGLCSVVSFGEVATLTIVNSECPEEQIVFSSPMSHAELKGCHAIQNLGAVETYLRRYLYVNAFDIVEHDALDGTVGKDKQENKTTAPTKSAPPQQSKQSELSEAQQKYFPRIKAALDSLYGEDVARKKDLIKTLTAWTNGEGKEIPGVEDYRKKDGKGLEILCHKIEAELKKSDIPL